MSKKKGRNKIFNIYNFAVLVCIVVIGVCLYIVFRTETKHTPSGIEVVDMKIGETKEITEGTAKRVAKKQFKILGESVNPEELEVVKFQRDGEEYYYISSVVNTVEIKLKGGKITRINSASVEE